MLVDNGTLVLAFNGARATFYRNLGKALHVELELIAEDRQPVPETAELGRDRPGRSFERTGQRRSSYETTDLHSQAEESFIRRCVERLGQLVAQERKPAIVIAPPEALGIARGHYSADLKKSIAREIDRDYSSRPAKDVAALLADY